MWDWLENLFNDGSGANVAAGGMMQGVPGFDHSDPGAYAGRTAGDADMGGYGGSPRLPDAPGQADWRGLMMAGNSLMQMGAPRGGGGGYRPGMSSAVRGNPALAQRLTSIFTPPQPLSAPSYMGGLLSEGMGQDPYRRMMGRGLLSAL